MGGCLDGALQNPPYKKDEMANLGWFLRERRKELRMAPAKSKVQQRYFGMVEAGKIPKPGGMSKKAVEEFAATKTKGLPNKAGGKKK